MNEFSVKTPRFFLVVSLVSGLLRQAIICEAVAQSLPLSPTAMIAASDDKTLYLACVTAKRVLRFDTVSQKVSGFVPVPDPPLGIALSVDKRTLYVICAAPESRVCLVALPKMKIIGFIHAGHTAMAPVLSPDGRTLYLCNRFDNDVSVIDLASKKQICRVPVTREPVAAAITKDGKLLLIANHIPSGRADANYVAAVITVIDTGLNRAIKELQMPNGSGSLNDIRVSPDGLYAVVPHLVSRFNRLPTHLSEGWINANALTVIDIPEMRVHGTILLDDHYRGMANPWSAAWSPDGKMLVLTHAGTHEISVIDFSTLLAELSALPGAYDPVKAADVFTKSKAIYEQPDNLPFAGRSRVRVKLDNGDLGPRASVFVCQTVYVANYFSDTLTAIDLSGGITKAKSIPLGGKPAVDAVRKGELYFHDATICYDGWQSCASCHPGDGRVDGFNWDLLNDGEGNPKNTKSLLLATKTPPLMSMGGRADAKVAIRAGIQNILFASQPQEDIVNSIFAYLQALKPVPSPFLVHAQLSAQARRGMKVFAKSGCADCHVPGLYTDLRAHDVGTRASGDKPTDKFYTPTLIEVWRTAPYLHDGSAPTMRAVVITRNPRDLHGATSNLSGQEIDDLCAYLLSL